jgi:hypothetical protein
MRAIWLQAIYVLGNQSRNIRNANNLCLIVLKYTKLT